MVRLIVLLVLFLLSLLCVFRAPALYLWYLSIMVTEFPLIFMGLTSILLLWGFKVEKYAAAGTYIGVIAFVLFLSPIVRAYLVADKIDEGLVKAYGQDFVHKCNNPGTTAFSFFGMISGHNNRVQPYVTKTYKTADGAPLTMDYYPSALSGVHPCLIVVHGGSWSGGDCKQLSELNAYLANAGYHVATINYRLAPKYLSPAPIEDLHDAMAYLNAHAAELSIDTTKFVLLGRSAGAQIVSAAAYQWHDPCIKGVISFYGPADMIWGYKNPASPWVLPSCKIMEDYFGGTYIQVPRKYVEGSPIESVSANLLPTLLIHGINDPLVAYKHSTRLIEKLQKVGAKYYLLTLPWATHGCDYTLNGPSGQLSTYTIERFMRFVTIQ